MTLPTLPATLAPLGGPATLVPLTGPAFSSYAADDVAFLLTDLSHVDLELPADVRERAIAAGRSYAEMLPVEYHPSAAYLEVFHAALRGSASRLAGAVGTVAELVRVERGRPPVLVSLARAGTPVGILLRRWARLAYGEDWPHYSISIVRGRGIDTVALDWLAAHHDPADVVFVDGWTGKGAIARELADALTTHVAAGGAAFPAEPAVLADPGHCTRLFGTREDFLIASACLNSTVSGLVSRTVLRDDLVGPHRFHGAKFYADLAAGDVSHVFLDAVTDALPGARDGVARGVPRLLAQDRTPTWAGWRQVERLAAEFGTDVNLVKPGVGETTRVLLRRVPRLVLVRPDAAGALEHVRLLAGERGVPLVERADLAYSCVGVIAAGAGADG